MTVNEEIKNNNHLFKNISFKKYEKYKKVNLIFLDEIPEHWKIEPLKNFVKYGTGNSISYETKELYEDSYDAKPYISTSDINLSNNQINYENGMYIKNNDKKFKVAPKNSTLVCIEGGSGGKKKGFTNQEVCFVNKLCYIKSFKYNDKFVYYSILSNLFNFNYGMNIYGDRNAVKLSRLKEFKFMIPPLEEQKQIADFLDKRVNNIDRSITNTKNIINDLVELKKSYPNTLVVNAKGQKYRLAYLLKERSIRNRPEMQLLSVVREKGVIVRNVNDPNENHNYIPDDLSRYKVVEKDQFVINNTRSWQGCYGVSKYDGIVSSVYLVFDLFVKNKQFFNVAIRTRYYIDQFARICDGVRPESYYLSKPDIKKIMFYLPSEEKQKEIGEKGTRVVENIDKLLEILRKKVKVLEELKQSLIFEVVTGRRDVRDVL